MFFKNIKSIGRKKKRRESIQSERKRERERGGEKERENSIHHLTGEVPSSAETTVHNIRKIH